MDLRNNAPDLTEFRLDRRTLLVGASALMGGLALGLRPVLAQEVVRGGELTASRTNEWPTLDPHLSTAAFADAALVCNYLTRYVNNGGTFELQPGLAESWTTPDDTTIVLKLREGVTFHDGSAFDAEAAKWNIDRMMSHPKSMSKANVATIAEAVVSGPHELTLKLKAPSASTLISLSAAADGLAAIISKAHAEEVGDEGLATTLVGTGPFKLQEWATGVHLKMVKNENYWEAGADGNPLPYLDGVTIQAIPDPAVAVLRLRAGDIDIVSDPRGDSVRSLRAEPSVTVFDRPWDCRWFVLGFNNKEGGLFAGDANREVRKAIASAIDGDSLSAVVDLAEANNQPLPPGSLGYSEAIALPAFDLEASKAALAASGFDTSQALTLDIISRPEDAKIAQFLQQMLADLGLNVTIRPSERTAFAEVMISGQYSMALFTSRSRVDPDLTMGVIFREDGTLNYAGWKDARVQELLVAGRSSSDTAERQAAYEEITKIALEEAYYNFPVRLQSAGALSNTVQGFSPSWSGFVADGTGLWLNA